LGWEGEGERVGERGDRGGNWGGGGGGGGGGWSGEEGLGEFRGANSCGLFGDHRARMGYIDHASRHAAAFKRDVLIATGLGLAAGLAWKMHHWSWRKQIETFYKNLDEERMAKYNKGVAGGNS